MEARLRSITEQLNEQMEFHNSSAQRAQLVGRQVQELRERVQALETELLSADVHREKLLHSQEHVSQAVRRHRVGCPVAKSYQRGPLEDLPMFHAVREISGSAVGDHEGGQRRCGSRLGHENGTPADTRRADGSTGSDFFDGEQMSELQPAAEGRL